MKKSNPSPKELMQKRISRSKLMRLPKDEGSFEHKENKLPKIIVRNKTFRKAEIKDKECPQNVFCIPGHMQILPLAKRPPKNPKPEPLMISEIRTVCDIDESFYEIIKGRLLKPPADIKTYMRQLRAITLFKADTGFLTERIASIDHAFAVENEEYEKVHAFYETTKWNYIQCIYHIYKTAKKIQITAETLENNINVMNEKLEAYSFEYVKTRNILQNVVTQFETRAVYARFLNFFTPEWWRREFESAHRLGNEKDYRIGEYEDVEVAKSETDILQEYKIALIKPKTRKLHLYFMQPFELMDVFDYIEQQCKNYIRIDVITSSLRTSILAKRDVVKEDVKLSLQELQYYIEHVEKKVVYWEEAAVAYETAFFKLLNKSFKHLFASEKNEKLLNCLQFTHAEIFHIPNDSHDSIEGLMNDIEHMYLELQFGLDELDQKIVKEATREFFANDIKMMARAHRANRSLKEADIFRKSLYTSFEPSRKNNYCK